MRLRRKPYSVEHQQDGSGRYHVWLVPSDPKNLPSVDDLYEEAKKLIDDFEMREFSLSQETLTAGAYHLTEKGFKSYDAR